MRFAACFTVLALVLCGCGVVGAEAGGTPTTAGTSTAKKSTAKKSAAVRTSEPPATGVSALEDLSRFHCDTDAKGKWNASGVLKNDGAKPASYQLTVFVGRADGKDAKAMTKEFLSIAAGGSIAATITAIPAAAGADTCYVRVLRK